MNSSDSRKELLNQSVFHKTMGSGKIIEIDGNYIKIQFENQKIVDFKHTALGTFLLLEKTDITTQSKADDSKKEKTVHEIKQEQIKKVLSPASPVRTYATPSFSESSDVIPSFPTVSSFCASMNQALFKEIVHLKNGGGKRIKLTDGVLLESRHQRYVYSFEADSELHLPDDTQITAHHGDRTAKGMIVNCEEFTIVLAINEDFGRTVPVAEITAEPWQLLNALTERLNAISTAPSDLVKQLILAGKQAIIHNHPIQTGQQMAVQMACTQNITFIWGPPGTGKTETLAKAAIAHLKMKHRILMLSYSNVSVDGALLRVNKLYPKAKKGTMLRYGYPRDKKLLESQNLVSFNYALSLFPELKEKRNKLLDERRKTDRNSSQYVRLSTQLHEIRTQMDGCEKNLIREARFVATTVSKATVDKTIYTDHYDVVIFDEASMAYIPQIVFAASLASKHFICLGDFKQLPPIVQNAKDSMLHADIFQYCGITTAVEKGSGHQWLCMLSTQYRMHPSIAEFVSQRIYHSLLKTAPENAKTVLSMTSAEPLSMQPLAFVDLSGTMSVCRTTKEISRINVLSAFMAVAAALKASKTSEVGIITPYNAQSRLIHSILRDIGDEIQHPIVCATVHQFQGSEKGVIIFDAVDCYRQTHPGVPLSSTRNGYANRLMNVAMTRAKGKFILMANGDYFDAKKLPKTLLLRQLFESFHHAFPIECTLREKELFWTEQMMPSFLMPSPNAGFRELFADLEKAQKSVYIDWPAGLDLSLYKTNRLDELLHRLKAKRVKVSVRSANRNTLPENIQDIVVENHYVTDPLIIIDKKIIWYGMPQSQAAFVAEGQTIPTRVRPIFRLEGTHTAGALYAAMEMDKTMDQTDLSEGTSSHAYSLASYITATCKCPRCGKHMKLKKGKGRFFLSCSSYPECTGNSQLTADIVNDYLFSKSSDGILCKHDGTSLIAQDGKYGVYVTCGGLSKHKYHLDEL